VSRSPGEGVDTDVGWSTEFEVGQLGESGLFGEFGFDEGLVNPVDETSGLSRLRINGVPSVQMTPEDHRPIDLHCPLVVNFLFLSLL